MGASFPACAFSFLGTFFGLWAKPRALHADAIQRPCGVLPERLAQARGLTVNRQGDLGEVAFVHKAMSLGFVVAKPYGQIHGYDFIVEGGKNLWRVQVKTSACMEKGLYHLSVRRRKNAVFLAYTESEVDFVVAYIVPEETWYVLPVRVVAGHRSFMLRPKECARRDRYAHYREAWHLLREPDGITF